LLCSAVPGLLIVNEIDSSVAEFVHVQSAWVGSLPVATPVAGAPSSDEISCGAIIEHASMGFAACGFAVAAGCGDPGAPALFDGPLDPHPATTQDIAAMATSTLADTSITPTWTGSR
jgi:hypothetical protein